MLFDIGYLSIIGLLASPKGLICSILLAIAQFKLFEMAGEEGWKAFVPLYNLYILFRIVEGRGHEWEFLLFLIPFYNIYLYIMLQLNIAKVFGKETWFGVLNVLFAPIMQMLIAYTGNSQYLGSLDYMAKKRREEELKDEGYL